MMTSKSRTALAIGAAIVVSCAIASVVMMNDDRLPEQPAPQVKADAPPAEVAPPAALPVNDAPPEDLVALPDAASTRSTNIEAGGDGVAPVTPPEAPRPSPKARARETPAGEPLIPLPVAREALKLVGADAEAEAIWTEAINDPNLPAEARSDLIEDLNEEGFVDPRHIQKDELPLILKRIEIIERLSADAMDEVNAAAFREAYKDLVNMLRRLTQP